MNINKLLKDKGYRITTERQRVLSTITSHPLTAQDIYETLKKNKVQIDLASVYRSLELFVNIGIVRVIELGEGKKRYEIIDEKNHHHHIICNSCGTIEDVSLKDETFLQKIKTRSKFKIDHHHLEFFGTCAECQ
jgi:Fur family transcriptional regulator, ferric uptake regulator